MKKVLGIIALVAIVVFIGSSISDAIDNSDQTAQAFVNPTVMPTVTFDSKKLDVNDKKTKVVLTATIKTKSAEKASLTFLPPVAMKDGAVYNIATSSVYANIMYIANARFRTGPVVAGPTITIKKKTNSYVVQWVINKATLPTGTYQFKFPGYTVGNSTTTIPFPDMWSKSVVISPTITTYLNGLQFMLTSYNGTAITANQPRVAFKDGLIRASFCNLLQGAYEVKDGKITATQSVFTPGSCAVANFSTLESAWVAGLKDGATVTSNGDVITLVTKKNGTFVFKQEVLAAAPVSSITSLSTSTTRIGTAVTITGANFGSSNIILMDNLSASLPGALPIAVVNATTPTTLTFTIPSTSVCPQPDSTLTITCPQVSVGLGAHSVQVRTTAGTSNAVALTLIP
jgi:heat shock protein HslJ